MTRHDPAAAVLPSPPATLPEHLVRWASARGGATAIRHKQDGAWVTWTWADLLAEVTRVAAALEAGGFAPGDALVIAAGGLSPPALAATLAAQTLGGAAVWVDAEDPGRAGEPASGLAVGGPAEKVRARFGLARDEATLRAAWGRLGYRESWVLGLFTTEHGLVESDPASGSRAYADASAGAPDAPAVVPSRARARGIAFFVNAAESGISPAGLGLTPSTHAELIEGAGAWLDAARGAAGLPVFMWETPTEPAAALLLAGWLVRGLCLAIPEDGTTADIDRQEVQPAIVAATGAAYGRLAQQVADNLPVQGSVVRAIADAGLAGANAGAARRVLGWWLVRRPLRAVLGLRRARVAYLLDGAPPPAGAVELFAQLDLRLQAVSAPVRADLASDRAGPYPSRLEPALSLPAASVGEIS